MRWIKNMLRGRTSSPSADWFMSSRTCEAYLLLSLLQTVFTMPCSCGHRHLVLPKPEESCHDGMGYPLQV